MLKMEQREKEFKEAQKEKDAIDLDNYTFRPYINPTSKSLARQVQTKEKLENKLISEGQILFKKKEQQRTLCLLQDMQKCTFRPEVDKKYRTQTNCKF